MGTAEGGSIFDRAGKIKKGYRFNALVIENMLDREYERPISDALERFCYYGDDRNIKERFIDGKKIDPDKVYEEIIER